MNAHLDISDRKKKKICSHFQHRRILQQKLFLSVNILFSLLFLVHIFCGVWGAVMLMTSERHTNLENRLLV